MTVYLWGAPELVGAENSYGVRVGFRNSVRPSDPADLQRDRVNEPYGLVAARLDHRRAHGQTAWGSETRFAVGERRRHGDR